MRQPSDGGSRTAPLFLRLVTPLLRARPTSKLQPAATTTFVLSTGRTGTVYIADLLNQLDGVVALHEPKPSRVLNAWTTAFLEGRVAGRFMATALFVKRRKTLKNIRADLYVESNNFIAGFADALHDVFENPTVIHLVRDPRDFATSLTNRGDDRGLRGFFNRYVPCWAYVPAGLKKRQLTPLTRPAYRWVAINEYLNTYGKSHPNYHFFKFEEVFGKNDQTELKRLLRAIGLGTKQISQLDFQAKARSDQPKFSLLDRPSTSTNASKHQTMPKWRDWSAEQRHAFEKICGPLMREYGYGEEPEWP
jgi:hypothetical protein